MKTEDQNTFLDINLRAIKKNYKIIKNKIGKHCTAAATVKANAYGLGIRKVIPSLVDSGCKNFFVATTDEAIELRKINKKIKIFILNGLILKNIKLIKKYNLIPIINNLSQLRRIEYFQNKNNTNIKIALHFDTGMSRLGLDESETKYLIQNKYKLLKFSKLVLVMSHLACADNPKSELNKKQLLKFLNLRKHFPTVPLSLSNSAGILLGKKYHFDMVRPGISLYGGHCRLNERKIYHNVVTLKSKLIQVREIKKNDSIGYGATYKAKTKMKIGTLSLGYADGINRLFSNNLNIHYKSKKIKVVGRISMDLITLDLSNISKNEKLDKIILDIISDNNSINKISKLINTIPYEILTNLGKRYHRRYIH